MAIRNELLVVTAARRLPAPTLAIASLARAPKQIAAIMRSLRPYALALVGVLVSTAVAYVVQPRARLELVLMIHLFAIVLLAMRFSVRVSLFAALVSVLAFDFVFIPPAFAFAWADKKSTLAFAVMILVAGVISRLKQRLREQEQLVLKHYELRLELAQSSDLQQLCTIATRHLEQMFEARVMVLIGAPGAWPEQYPGAQCLELAERAWNQREFIAERHASGWGIYVPLSGVCENLGVIGLDRRESLRKDSRLGVLLCACAGELSTTIERIQLAEVATRSQLEAETEGLRSSLLSVVSHDLKSPLSSIIAAGTTLIGHRNELDRSAFDELLSTMVTESERLNRLIQNLLSVTRLESPLVALRRTPEAIDEILYAALDRLGKRLDRERLHVELPRDLPLVSVEPVLVEQILVNLLENALRYAGSNCHIFLRAQCSEKIVTLQVEDDGPGIADAEREMVFEKFYRGKNAAKSHGGMGLGLAICRAIIRAHGGSIAIRERIGGGTLVEFTLPVFCALPMPVVGSATQAAP